MTIRIFKKDKNKPEPKKKFDPRTGEETNKPGGKDPRTIYTPMKRGGLKGKQKKLDKNNNGRIDAEDFKLLKADKPMKAAMGKSVRGYGAARTSGTGLMDEQMAPGKVINAKRGKFTKFTKVFETAAKAGDKGKGTSTIVGVKPNVQKQVFQAKKKKYSSMEEMRKAKGFRPGESAESFNKRRLKLAGAKKALGATRLGKIALGVAAAGIGAKKYLESKMNKKMGGGMMKKYSKGGGADTGKAGEIKSKIAVRLDKILGPSKRGRATDMKVARRELYKSTAGKKIPAIMGGGMMKKYNKGGGADTGKIGEMKSKLGVLSNKVKRTNERLKRIGGKPLAKKMGGGMMKKPMGYDQGAPKGGIDVKKQAGRSFPKKNKKFDTYIMIDGDVKKMKTGSSVMARGCKLGRKKATKIT